MFRRILLRFSRTSSSAALVRLCILAGLCLGIGAALPGVASAATYAPVASYSFDEDEGATAADTTGDGHTATVEGAEWTPHGRYGGGMQFSAAAESMLTIPDSDELDMTEEFTLEAWVRPEDEGEWETLFAKEDSASPYYSYLLYARDHDARLAAHLDDGVEERELTSEPAALRQDAWTHVALTFDGAKARLYVDGTLVATRSSDELPATDGALRIGGNGIWGEYFTGRIDEVRVYDRVLSGADVAYDMEAPILTPKAGPVADYSFDEDEGGETVEDVTGDEHTATIDGATRTEHGRYGGALEFDAAEEAVVRIPDSPELDFSEEFTLEAWVRPSLLNNEISPALFKAAGEGETGQSYAYRLYEGGAESNHPMVAIKPDPGTTHYVESAEALPKHVWSHIAFTYDGSDMHVFVDGVEVGEAPSESPAITDGELEIGGASALGNFFDGRIDEVRIYNRELNGAEVVADMEAPIQTPTQGPVAEYSFDEGEEAGTTAEDLSGDGNTATLEGATRTTHGRYGSALEFDGESDCVSVPNSEDLQLSEEFTLEAWVRPTIPVVGDPLFFKEEEGEESYALGIGFSQYGRPQGYLEGESITSPDQIANAVWTHLALTWDGAHTRLYVDGEEVAERSPGPHTLESKGPLEIGCDGVHAEHFGGRIDEARVYERALSSTEVRGDMEAPIEIPRQGPVAEYSFDEDDEGTAADVTGDGHTATIEGATWTPHGRYGGAMEFDAAKEDVLKIPASPELDLAEEFTLEAWVRPEEARKWAPILSKEIGDGESPDAQSYWLFAGGASAGEPWAGLEDAAHETYSAGSESLPDDAWSHLALTWDGVKLRLYVDGELEGTTYAPEPPITTGGDLEIGGSSELGGFFDGRIDEARIYNRELNGAEVVADMEAPIQTPRSEPIGQWGFNEGEGSMVQDASGDEHEGTIEGAEWARGKYGDSLQFDGEDDVVKIPNSPEFALTEGFTLESWVRPESESNEWAPILAKEIGGGEAAEELAWWLDEAGHNPNVPIGGTETSSSEQNEALGEDPLPVDVWSYVALTYDGSQVVLYVNGELVDCSEAPSNGPRVTEGELQIGGASEAGDFFGGRIDEVRIYNRAVSREEVVSDMETPVSMELSESYSVEVEEEGEEAGTVVATASLQALGPGDIGGRTRLLLMFQQTGVGHVMTPKQKEEYGITGKGEVRIQAYRFNVCPEILKEINAAPGKASMPGRKILLKLAKNGESRQCHSFYDEEAGKEFKVVWAVSGSGLFFRRPGKEVFVKEPPVCKQSGPYAPQKYTDCEIPDWRSTKRLDVIGDWKFVEGNYDSTIGGGQVDNAEICARMDGVLPINVEPSINGEEVFQGNHHGEHNGPHWHYWLANQFGTNRPCYFDNPKAHGYFVSGR